MKPALFLWGLLLLAGSGQGAEAVKFGDALHAKFHHERCLSCHQFNSRKSQGRSFHSHRSRYACNNCHTPQVTGLPAGTWMAPPGERMDYTGMNARDTCLLAKRNSGSGDVQANLLNHLLHDERVHWALEGGKTPMGQFATVPGGYQAWVSDVQAWARDGMRCE